MELYFIDVFCKTQKLARRLVKDGSLAHGVIRRQDKLKK